MKNRPQNMIDVMLFSDIVNGKLNPSLKKYNNPTNLSKLIHNSQIQKFTVTSFDDFNLTFDYSIFGFKNEDDFKIKKVKKRLTNQTEVSILPEKIYELQEDFTFPDFPSLKVNTFIHLIVDEFERIKTRADRKHDLLTSEKHLNFYSKKNIQKTKKIFHDAKNCLGKLNEKENLEDFFILFVLCQFLIRTILFYQKHFKHFIDFKLDDEQDLYAELYAKAFNGNLEFIFKYGLMGFNEQKKRSHENEKSLNDSETIVETFLNSCESGDCFCKNIAKVGWYGQINTLVDALEQVIYSKYTNEIKGSEVSRGLILSIICVYFSKNGKCPMSPHTIRTCTNIDRIDKRLKEDSSKRLHISIKEE
jgi:hypothetical protein